MVELLLLLGVGWLILSTTDVDTVKGIYDALKSNSNKEGKGGKKK